MTVYVTKPRVTLQEQLKRLQGGKTFDTLSITGADPNSVLFLNPDKRVIGNSDVISVNSAGNVGIGTSSPSSKLTISNNTALPNSDLFNSGFWNANLRLVGANSTGNGILLDAIGATPGIYGRRAQGTVASPTTVPATFTLLTIAGFGYGATGYSGTRVQITFNTSETWTDTAQGTQIQFNTTTTGTTTLAERMRIDSAGNIGIGTSSPDAKLDINGTSRTRSGHKISGYFNANAGDGYVINIGSTGNINYIQSLTGATTNPLSIDASTITFRTGAFNTSATFDSSGNVGIGTTTPGYKLEVNGSFAATTKSFVIPHPTKPNKKLRYGSLEGPENGVYLRGKLIGNTIELPEYWTKLVDSDSITVTLTPIGRHQKLYVEDIINNTVIVGNESEGEVKCFYVVYGERCDVDKLEVEID